MRRSTLACLLALCAAHAAGPPGSDLDTLRSGAGNGGFTAALAPRPLEFPRDHGPHPDFRHEWWYVTGNLDSTRGERFGFELTFFRLALAPPGPQDTGSRWRTRQIYAAHFAITDLARGQFRFAEKFSRAALGLAGAQAEPLHVWIDDWALGEGSTDWKLRAA